MTSTTITTCNINLICWESSQVGRWMSSHVFCNVPSLHPERSQHSKILVSPKRILDMAQYSGEDLQYMNNCKRSFNSRIYKNILLARNRQLKSLKRLTNKWKRLLKTLLSIYKTPHEFIWKSMFFLILNAKNLIFGILSSHIFILKMKLNSLHPHTQLLKS